LSKSVINEKYFDKYRNKKMHAKIRVALGVCFSIDTNADDVRIDIKMVL